MGKKRLLISDSCRHCDSILSILRTKINTGDIEVINIDRPENKDARQLARLFGGVPTLVEEENGELIELKLE